MSGLDTLKSSTTSAKGGNGGKPVAVPGAYPLEGSFPLLAHLFDDGSFDDGEVVKWEWNFGGQDDGTGGWHDYTASRGDAWYTYEHPGTAVAHLRVTDDEGNTNTAFVKIRIRHDLNAAPVAMANADQLEGDAPLTVSFDAAGSYDPDGTIETWEWDFGAGGGFADYSSSEGAAEYTYTTAGSYTATLRVTDDDGASATAEVAITANEPPREDPVICFSARKNGMWGIYVTDALGSYFDLVYENSQRIGGCVYSPDGEKIAFALGPSYHQYICAVMVDGSGFWQLGTGPYGAGGTTWQDSNYILYEANSTGEDAIMKVKFDDPSTLHQVSPSNGFSEKESWISPDGTQITFTGVAASGSSGARKVYVADYPSFSDVDVVGDVGGNTWADGLPCWSYATDRIAFGSWVSSAALIYTVNPDGSDLVQLSPSGTREWYPRFSADGSEIVFESYVSAEGKYEIFVMDSETGGDRRRITYGFDEVGPPDWLVPR